MYYNFAHFYLAPESNTERSENIGIRKMPTKLSTPFCRLNKILNYSRYQETVAHAYDSVCLLNILLKLFSKFLLIKL